MRSESRHPQPSESTAGPDIVRDAECSVLAAMLLNHESIGKAFSLLGPRDFGLSAHVRVFEAIAALHNRNEKADVITVCEELRKRGDLDVVGGPPAVAGILESATTSANLEAHAAIVRESALMRGLRRAALELQAAANVGNGSAEEILRQHERRIGLLSAKTPKGGGLGRNNLRFETAAVLCARTPDETPWLVPGLVAPGAVTELDGKLKCGKTTFVAALVRSILDGGEFLGMSVRRSKVVWLTEQPSTSFRQVLRRAGLEGRDDLVILSWHDTRDVLWHDVVGGVVRKACEIGAELLVVDTLGQFAGLAGDAENSAGEALRAIQPLQVAAAEGLGVLVLRHERKSGGDVGDSARGSSAFGGAVDVILALRRPEGAQRHTLRVLHGLSRFDETPHKLMIELVGSNYVAHGTAHDVASREARERILAELSEDADQAATLDSLLARVAGLSRSTAQRTLTDLAREGVVVPIGSGRRGNPRRYHRANDFGPNSLSKGGGKSGDFGEPGEMVSAQTLTSLGGESRAPLDPEAEVGPPLENEVPCLDSDEPEPVSALLRRRGRESIPTLDDDPPPTTSPGRLEQVEIGLLKGRVHA